MVDLFDHYVLPISGTDFVRYMAYYSILSEYGFKPKQIYCASGGCLVSYIAMMSNFGKQIESWNIDSDMIIEHSTPFKLSTFTYVMSGYLYRRPEMLTYLERTFVPCKMRDVEIISGYYKSEEKKVIISTNFTAETSSITAQQKSKLSKWRVDITHGPTDVKDMMSYTNDTIRRTTNIPYLLESDDKSSVDFGVIAPTPRILLNIDPSRTIYFSPIDITTDRSYSLPGAIFQRMIVNDIIALENRFQIRTDFNDITAALSLITTKHNSNTRYALVMYTKSSIALPITKFTSTDVRQAIVNAKTNMGYTVYYD